MDIDEESKESPPAKESDKMSIISDTFGFQNDPERKFALSSFSTTTKKVMNSSQRPSGIGVAFKKPTAPTKKLQFRNSEKVMANSRLNDGQKVDAEDQVIGGGFSS